MTCLRTDSASTSASFSDMSFLHGFHERPLKRAAVGRRGCQAGQTDRIDRVF